MATTTDRETTTISITAASAPEHPPPKLSDDRAGAAEWFRMMTGCDWDGSNISYKNAKKRYERLLPAHKERERERECKRNRSDRERPAAAKDSKRRATQRKANQIEEDAARECRNEQRRQLQQRIAKRKGILNELLVKAGLCDEGTNALQALRERSRFRGKEFDQELQALLCQRKFDAPLCPSHRSAR